MGVRRVLVIGAGIGGLAAALDLAAAGAEVTVLERHAALGGKMRTACVGGRPIDVGPTVLTMRWVFDELFAHAGRALDAYARLRPAAMLARHVWDGDGAALELFGDVERSAAAIGAFASAADARAYRAFCLDCARVYRTLEASFLRRAQCGPWQLARTLGCSRGADLLALRPFRSLWRDLAQRFHDPRLRQLFARYATYCGSSPFAAPATLRLIAHVERSGVWLVDGGMVALAQALARRAGELGVRLRSRAAVRRIVVAAGRARGVELEDGERLDADAIVANVDCAALATGRLGDEVRAAVPAPPSRSLSAVTWALTARADGMPLARHNVFFSADYRAEFDSLFARAELPRMPTIYVCAQDRDDAGAGGGASERLFLLVNAPAVGDGPAWNRAQLAALTVRVFDRLADCGLHLRPDGAQPVISTPHDFERLFPGTGGALYGMATHGWRAAFRRPGARTPIEGLFLAGGSVHPGPGVPMAALSGRIAAASVLQGPR